MFHKFHYLDKQNKMNELHSYLVVEGSDQHRTAMAKTVGLPIGIVSKMILEGAIQQRGVLVPVHKEVYLPILNELKNYGINFTEKKII